MFRVFSPQQFVARLVLALILSGQGVVISTENDDNDDNVLKAPGLRLRVKRKGRRPAFLKDDSDDCTEEHVQDRERGGGFMTENAEAYAPVFFDCDEADDSYHATSASSAPIYAETAGETLRDTRKQGGVGQENGNGASLARDDSTSTVDESSPASTETRCSDVTQLSSLSSWSSSSSSSWECSPLSRQSSLLSSPPATPESAAAGDSPGSDDIIGQRSDAQLTTLQELHVLAPSGVLATTPSGILGTAATAPSTPIGHGNRHLKFLRSLKKMAGACSDLVLSEACTWMIMETLAQSVLSPNCWSARLGTSCLTQALRMSFKSALAGTRKTCNRVFNGTCHKPSSLSQTDVSPSPAKKRKEVKKRPSKGT